MKVIWVKVIRRLYVYLMTAVGLGLMLSGAFNLLKLALMWIFGVEQGTFARDIQYRREQFSSFGALLVVGAVVWVIHWMLAQRAASPSSPDGAEERQDVRKLLIYGVLFVTVGLMAFAVKDLLAVVLAALPDGDSSAERPLGYYVIHAVSSVIVFGAAWAYYWRVRISDNRLTPEEGAAVALRRWYFYLVSFIALSVTMWQLADLGRYLWRVATQSIIPLASPGEWLPASVAENIAWILVAGAVWLLHWRWVQALTATSHSEQVSKLRGVYLYGMILATAAFALWNTAMFLYNIMRVFWGTDPVAGTGDSLLTAAGDPVVNAIVPGAFWAYHWWVVRWQMGLAEHDPRLQANLRRLYYALVSVLGLATLAGGAANMLRVLFDLWLGGEATYAINRQGWGDQISIFATSIIVGAPIWLFMWWRMQQWAMAPGATEERQAVVRRGYLYLVLAGSILPLVGATSVLIYQFLYNVGTDPSRDDMAQVSWALGIIIVAGMLLAYHLYVLRGDMRARPAPPVPEILPERVSSEKALVPLPATALVLLSDHSGIDFEAAVAVIKRELPAGSLVEWFPAENMTPAEVIEWLAARSARLGAPGAPTTPIAPEPPAPQAPEAPAPPSPRIPVPV